MNDLYKYRVKRFDNLIKSWKLKRMHDLMVNHEISENLLYELKQAIMLYISKAFYFNYFEDENKFLRNLKENIYHKENITPNGAVVHKREYQLEYNRVLRAWAKVVGFIIKDNPTLLSKYRMTPNIRIKIPDNIKPDKRKLDTAWPHSDAWVEGPWGMNCYTPLIGDVDNNTSDPVYAKLSTLIQWHYEDSVDDWERNRNDIIYYNYQNNRNPFIDHPNLVNFIWGDSYGEEWNETLDVSENNELENFKIYPNPSNGVISFNYNIVNSKIEIFNLTGKKIREQNIINSNFIDLNLPSGIYFIKTQINERLLNSKIIIK